MDDDPTTADLFITAVLKVAGSDGLAKVRAIAGGIQIHVPIYATEGSAIVRALGIDDARQVCEDLRVFDPHGRPTALPTFYFPKCQAAKVEQRRARTLELRLQGKTKGDIAVLLDVTDATVRRDLRILEREGRISRNLPSFHPRAQALAGPNRKVCGLIAAPDHPADLGGMVPPTGEDAP